MTDGWLNCKTFILQRINFTTPSVVCVDPASTAAAVSGSKQLPSVVLQWQCCTEWLLYTYTTRTVLTVCTYATKLMLLRNVIQFVNFCI